MLPDELTTAVQALISPQHVIVIPGEPHPKRRPRLGNRRAYTAEDDLHAEARTGWLLSQAIPAPLTGNIAMTCIFFRRTRRIVDADNLLKHVCDAGNRILWRDDSQCTAKLGVIELDRANPRTVVLLGTHRSSLVRS
ncbi:RusA family crossover junction endodeoxyribonuclease [Nocardia sp. CA-128927]|uniref:RusA family crossover junction endodeoxyribonuclease n=1 Tax=Nocardia sp. CA-128927 TaxID=3239975 RepID=UPI003D976DB9